jgi:hypothetical protein
MIKKTLHFVLNFLQTSTFFASFSRAHAGTLQNHSISPHQSPGYFDHVSEFIVIIFKTYFENDQNILTSSKFDYRISSHQINDYNYFNIFNFFYLFLNIYLIIYKSYCAILS